MKKYLFLFLILLLSAAACPDRKAPPEAKYAASYTGLHLREKPDRNSRSLALLPYGTRVTLLARSGKFESVSGKKGEWVQVSAAGSAGYVFYGFLTSEQIDTKILMEGSSLTEAFPLENRNFGLSEICDRVLIRSTFGKTLSFRSGGRIELAFVDNSPAYDPKTKEGYSVQYAETKHGGYRTAGRYVEVVFDRKITVKNDRGKRTRREEKIHEKQVCAFALCGKRKAVYCYGEGMFLPEK